MGTVVGVIAAVFGASQIGSLDIVFADEEEKIYVAQRNWLYLQSSSRTYGTYSDFDKAVVHTEDVGGDTFYSVQFQFSGKVRANIVLKKIIGTQQDKETTATEINGWW